MTLSEIVTVPLRDMFILVFFSALFSFLFGLFAGMILIIKDRDHD